MGAQATTALVCQVIPVLLQVNHHCDGGRPPRHNPNSPSRILTETGQAYSTMATPGPHPQQQPERGHDPPHHKTQDRPALNGCARASVTVELQTTPLYD